VISGIIQARREATEARRASTPLPDLVRRLKDAGGGAPIRPFVPALSTPDRISLIAELKKASPSKGILREDFRPAKLAELYAGGGAAALSILTEPTEFLGTYADLAEARAACDLPCLQKDFVLDEYQIYEGRLVGADAVLLIVDLLKDEDLRGLVAVCGDLGMTPLLEVRNEEELERAIGVGAQVIGVNHRNLWTFDMDMTISERLIPRIKEAGRIAVAESGIATRDDVKRMATLGADAILVGESIVSSSDVGAKIRELIG